MKMNRDDLIAHLLFARENMCLNCTYDDILDQAIEMIKGQEPCEDAISRSALLAAYDAAHKGPPGGARKLIEEASAVCLKGQESRLVTYEDFHSGREDGGEAIPCWKEARKKTRRSGWAVIVYGKMLADLETGVARYWTARPTEEQMREEAWPIMK